MQLKKEMQLLINNSSSLIESYIKISKLELESSFSEILAIALLLTIGSFFIGLCFLFMGIAIVFIMCYLTDNIAIYWSFLSVGMGYLLAFGILFFYRRRIFVKLDSYIISLLLSRREKEKSENN